MAKITETSTVSPYEKARKAQEAYEALRGDAIKELLETRKELDRKLKSLGYESAAPANNKKASFTTPDLQKFCKICKIPGHDGRLHRAQKEKKPYTPEELKKFGL